MQNKIESKKFKKLRPKKLRAYIPSEGQALLPEDLLRWQEKSILITGKPGVGKTSVVLEMLRVWAEKEYREIDYMFYFDESVLAHDGVSSLEALLFDGYLRPMEKDRKEVFEDIEENNENVVIVFDGVTDLEEKSIFWKIMNNDLLPDAKIVITCRSEVEDDPVFSDWPSQTVYVQGFSEESIKTYYRSRLSHDPGLLEVVLKNQGLISLSHVPLYAFMIVSSIKSKNGTVFNNQHTVTGMYVHIFRFAAKKHGNKQNKQIDKYLKEKKDQIHLLMENAFNATMKKCLNLPDISCDETFCHAFLKMITTRDSTTYCAFLHNTMQEFFSALWLHEHPDEIEDVLQLCQTEKHKHMRHVLPFLCGLLSEHNTRLLKCLFAEDKIKRTSDYFIEKLLDTFLQAQSENEDVDLLYVCQCLYELQSPKACSILLEKIDHRLDLDVDLDPHHCCALSYVIGQSRDKEVYLNLEHCNVTDVGIDMMLSCSPYIRLKTCKDSLEQITFFVELFHKSSQCDCKLFEVRGQYNPEEINALLDLCSHVKIYETQTGRSYLPALQSVFQSPDKWIIDLSERKISILLEVLKLQKEKKAVELRRFSEEEREVKSFLQCLPYISQLRFSDQTESRRFLLRLFIKAAEIETQTGEQMLNLLVSFCTSSYYYEWTYIFYYTDFLLDLYSHVKIYETQTGRSYLPALQSVFQSPDQWILDLSKRKSSILLEVLKLQKEKKAVDLRRCSEEEREVKSFLQCLPYISQLRFSDQTESRRFLLRLFIKAAEIETQTGEQMLNLLVSFCTSSYDYEWTDIFYDTDFLLDLYSHVKIYETQTGRSYLPALQSVFQSPDKWIIDLSERKSSILLEVLKLQKEKKAVDLSRCSEEEREVKSFLQCLPYISQLRFWRIPNKEERMCSVRVLLNLCVAAEETDRNTGTRFSSLLLSVCSYKTFPFDEEIYDDDDDVQTDFLLDLFSHVKIYETQTGRSYLPALQSVFQSPDKWIIDLSERKISILLEVLKLQKEKKAVDLRRCSEEEREVKSFLQCLPYISQLRLSKETSQKLVECVYEGQEEELTQRFLQKVEGDLTSCSLNWEELQYFLRSRIQQITVDVRNSDIQCRISEILPFLNRIQFKRMSSAFMLRLIREIYESGSAAFASSLLSSVENYINLQSRDLDSVHCDALRFTLQHCTAASLNLQWTSVPEEELESILPLFTHVSSLSVDRLLLLKILHCCSVSDVQQEAAAVLLSVLQHKLDFSCRFALDLTTNTDSEPLHLTTDDCCVMSRVIQRAHSDTKTQLILQDCEIPTAGMNQLFPVLHSVQLCCDKPLLLQFLAHVRPEEAHSLSQALGGELDVSQTPLDLQACRGLELILEYSEGLTELDLSQCHLTDDSLDLLLPNLHKAQNIDFSGNDITDAGADKIYRIVTLNSNIKTVRLFSNRIDSRELFSTDPRFEIW
ncbi:uncharacterized protein LOC122329695 isoform X1 [Puntigrus tetrazona]|uniref:uncharacterized protein LOC122329695 isoform X1 n=1 Tax=Puntigrus tetrazona TaxID=1606681 RepID=UPI001C8A48F5|nr:uncharacterized protein LOC122329695 isoform X1 [Puntigrus tetrazona]